MEYHTPARDTTNYTSAEYLHINSRGTQRSGGRAFTTSRPNGRVDYHIVLVAEGELRAEYRGETRTLRAGDFVVYPPGERQLYSFSGGVPSRTCWVHFAGTAVPQILASLGIGGGFGSARSHELVLQTFDRLIGIESPAPAGDAIRNGTLLVLLGFLARRSDERAAPAAEAVAPAVRLLRSEYARPVSAAECAALCCMSESRFQHVFRETVGVSPHRFLLNVRIDAAKELLAHTELRVSDAAALCGFDDPLYFSRIFRRECGVSPREWARARRG